MLLTPKEGRNDSKKYLEVFRMDYSPGSEDESSPTSKRKLSLGAIYEDENWCDIGRRKKDFPSTVLSSCDLLMEVIKSRHPLVLLLIIQVSSLPDRIQLLVGSYDTHVGVPGVFYRPTMSASNPAVYLYHRILCL